MKVLVVHEYYRERGGEDESFEHEAALLEAHGHDVIRYSVHNDTIDEKPRLALAVGTVWNREHRHALERLAMAERPDVAHFHNTFPLLSPAAATGVKRVGIPVVQTLRNYRLVCPNGLLFRDGRPCEDCIGRRAAWPGVVHRCYRNSRAASAVTAGMLAVHRAARTWARSVDLFIALSDFSRQRLMQGGIDGDRIAVKPNFLAVDPGSGTGSGGYALFVGRLAPEKGVGTLIRAWRTSLGARIPLLIVGDGPLRAEVEQAASESDRIRWLGQRPSDEVMELVGDARCLVMPSECYETFGRVMIEAFARSTPVLASDLGAMAEIVDDAQTGFLFRAGDAAALGSAVARFLALGPELESSMRLRARQQYETNYSAASNLEQLIGLYGTARDRAARSVASRGED